MERNEKHIGTNKWQHYSFDPDYIYLADKIKIGVDCRYFDSPNKTKQNQAEINLQNK